jgi:hypothetical protein
MGSAQDEGGNVVKDTLKELGSRKDLLATVSRMRAKGLIRVPRPLTAEEVEREFNRIRNDGRHQEKKK